MSSFYDSVKYPVESTRPSIVVEWFRFKHTLEISVEISTSGKYRFSIWGLTTVNKKLDKIGKYFLYLPNFLKF